MDRTRIDYEKRLELLKNRANSLSSDLAKIEQELEILTKLRDFYRTNPEDIIDDDPGNKHLARSLRAIPKPDKTDSISNDTLSEETSSKEPLSKEIPIKKPGPSGIGDKVFELLKSGPATHKELCDLLELGSKPISDALSRLRRDNKVYTKDGYNYAKTSKESDKEPFN